MAEQLIEWHPTSGLDAPAGAVDVTETDGQLTLILRFSSVVNGLPRDLRLHFGRVVAFSSHEEFAHPWLDAQTPQPRLSGAWSKYTFPCIEVLQSSWQHSFGESRLFGRGQVRHFQVVSLDKTVDILTTGPVHASWLAG
jgi:hypothetical protein